MPADEDGPQYLLPPSPLSHSFSQAGNIVGGVVAAAMKAPVDLRGAVPEDQKGPHPLVDNRVARSWLGLLTAPAHTAPAPASAGAVADVGVGVGAGTDAAPAQAGGGGALAALFRGRRKPADAAKVRHWPAWKCCFYPCNPDIQTHQPPVRQAREGPAEGATGDQRRVRTGPVLPLTHIPHIPHITPPNHSPISPSSPISPISPTSPTSPISLLYRIIRHAIPH